MSKKSVIKGSSIYFLSNVSSRILNMAYVVVVARLVGADGLGLIGLAISVKSISLFMGMMGMSMSAQKYLSGSIDDDKRRFLGGMITLVFTISVFIAGLVYFGSEITAYYIFDEPELVIILQLIAITIIFDMPSGLFRSVFTAQQKVFIVFKLNFVESLSKILALVLYFVVDDKLIAIVSALIFGSIITFIYGSINFLKLKLKPIYDLSLLFISNTVKKSMPFFFIGIGYFVLSQTDRVMLGIFLNSETVGYYIIAASLAQSLTAIHSSIVSFFMPQISDNYNRGDINSIETIYNFSTKVSSFLNLMALMILLTFGLNILQLLFGVNSDQSYYVLLILALVIVIGATVGPSGALLSMTDNQHVEFLNSCIQVSTNIILNYFLIKYFGLIGAAIATFISGVVLNALQIYEIKARLNINLLNNRFLTLSPFLVGILLIRINYFPLNDLITNLILFGILGSAVLIFAYSTLSSTEIFKLKEMQTLMCSNIKSKWVN